MKLTKSLGITFATLTILGGAVVAQNTRESTTNANDGTMGSDATTSTGPNTDRDPSVNRDPNVNQPTSTNTVAPSTPPNRDVNNQPTQQRRGWGCTLQVE